MYLNLLHGYNEWKMVTRRATGFFYSEQAQAVLLKVKRPLNAGGNPVTD